MNGNHVVSTGLLDFLGKHWRGEYSLARSTWGHGLLVTFFVKALNEFGDWAPQHLSMRGYVLLTLAIMATNLVIWGWLVRGIWCSASRKLREGEGKFGANLARVSVLLGCLGVAGQLIPTVFEGPYLWQLMLGWQPSIPPAVTVSADGKTLFFRGGFQEGSYALVADTLSDHPNVTEVVLHSEGGWIGEVFAVGELIRMMELDTHVEDECSSSCTFAYLSGKERTAAKSARLGFNQPRIPFADYETEFEFRELYVDHGLPPQMAGAAASVRHFNLWTPPLDELMAAGVITAWKTSAEPLEEGEPFSLD